MKLSVTGPRIWRRLSRCLFPSGGRGASVAPEPGGGVDILPNLLRHLHSSSNSIQQEPCGQFAK